LAISRGRARYRTRQTEAAIFLGHRHAENTELGEGFMFSRGIAVHIALGALAKLALRHSRTVEIKRRCSSVRVGNTAASLLAALF
jgi:hypothetical protein